MPNKVATGAPKMGARMEKLTKIEQKWESGIRLGTGTKKNGQTLNPYMICYCRQYVSEESDPHKIVALGTLGPPNHPKVIKIDIQKYRKLQKRKRHK